MKFSVITVCLNPGEKLDETLESVLGQTCTDVEVILKDGGSRDGSVERWQRENASRPGADRIKVFVEKDRGIYDAMNQAVTHASGDFLLFLNCGDVFSDEGVLERTLQVLEEEKSAGTDMDRLVLYGDTGSEKNGVTIASAPKITGFTCYRNIPCHQSCFYSTALCREKPYDLQYRIRADYDHFLWCYYRAEAKMRHMDFPVSSYEGGGFSESRENRERDRLEHKQITREYMNRGELLRYRAVMACTLAPLRSVMAESRMFSGVYHWLKEQIYRRKLWFLAAFAFFLLEMALLVWPVGWLREEQVNSITGQKSWVMEGNLGNMGFCQEFSPAYPNLKSIGILMVNDGQKHRGGNAFIVVTDAEAQVLFEKQIPYERFSRGSYTAIEMELSVVPGKNYYLSVNLEADAAGVVPALAVSPPEEQVKENTRLLRDEWYDDVQLMTEYSYTGVITTGKFLKALLLCGLAALGIALGLPKDRKVRSFIGIMLLIMVPYVLGRRLELLSVEVNLMLPISMKWNIGLMYLLEIIVLLCTQSFRFSICFSNIFLTLLYSANYYVLSFRGEPLRLNDMMAIGTAAKVAGRYDLRPDSHMAMAWCILAVFLVYGAQTGIRRKPGKRGHRGIWRLAGAVSGIALAVAGGYVLLGTELLAKVGFTQIHGFERNINYRFNGYLVASLMDIQYMRSLKIQALDGYSAEKAEELLTEAEDRAEKAGDAGEQQLPHIILIMNESFSDLRVLGDLQLNEENLEFFNSLRENTVRGYVNASVLGGGTANSEFEVFTGCSMGFLPPSYYPYQQAVVKSMPSMISRLKEAGYTTYSLHPEAAGNWNRYRVYQYLGFDYSLWAGDFKDAEVIHSGVSDLSTYEKVEELFESRGENERLFIFDLTMQNHGGYTQTDIEPAVQALNMYLEEADNYLSLVQESDRAFRQLITYFSQQEEPAIICMFGDHQPKLTDDFYERVYEQTEGLDIKDQRLNMYKTPFVIWANYNIQEQEGLDIGMNYLGVLLMDTAGISGSPFFSFLQLLMKEYPIISINGYEDREGNYHDWSGSNSELMEYRILQYNYLFDENIVEWGF